MKDEKISIDKKECKAKLLNSLGKKNCFFFTGSGISIESQIASVVDVLNHTCNKFLSKYDCDYSCVPKQVSRKDYICQDVQPELFYSVLLDCAGTERVLEMWNCLKQDHFSTTYYPQPNIIHYLIVAYSYIASVPVFTMNYDKMLENACENLSIPFCVYTEAPPSESIQNQVIICKLHGNLKEKSGNRVSQTDIGTTMSDISIKNSKWLEYIESFMKTHDMYICGYSGRDIDYFPFLRDYTKKDGFSSSIFWTIGYPHNSEIDRITGNNALSCFNANIINGYPSDMKNELIMVLSSLEGNSRFVSNICKLVKKVSVSKKAKEDFLKDIESSIDASEVSFNSEIFWMLLMKTTGQNKALREIIEKLLEQKKDRYNSLTEKEEIRLLEARVVLARERADFATYRQTAKELKKNAKKSGLPDKEKRRYLEIAKVQYLSSLQMCVPSALALKVPPFKRRYGLLLLVRIGFALLNYRFQRKEDVYNNNMELAQECEIRSLAIDCRLVKYCKDFFKKKRIIKRLKCMVDIITIIFIGFEKRTIKRLKDLRKNAYDIGNYGTVIGTNKYLARLESSDIYEGDIKSFGTLVSDLSALSIINREDDPDEALMYAEKNDNTLNIVKAIFSKKQKINEGDPVLTITDREKQLLLKSIKIITPNSLSKTLEIMGKRENLFLE